MLFRSILLSPEPGSHILPPLEDRRPRRSAPSPGTSPLGTRLCAQCRHMLHMSSHCPAHARVTARVGSDTKCNTPTHPRVGPVTPGSCIGSLDWPHRSTLVFSAHFVLTRALPGTSSRSVTHPWSAPGQARLTSEFLPDELPEKKVATC